ncbi:ABC transporter substrate-binding protein [Pseudomonas savastanoi]|uniref:ABC transporter substrate-binding protein n=1 Tax=Pseudomonas savastanoi TaxID=29438 RepID=UPI000BA3729D|nr:ABC transporter substrate-binding protein [Pseudomonas savastanoi]PAB28689.1 ABC transporter substrate-binding protein [Pseudomonas savastanoi]RMU44903.1 ABC transporter periplasmic [Pseudomonas savastanoi pv. nerii]
MKRRSLALHAIALGTTLWMGLTAGVAQAAVPLKTVTFIQEWPVADGFWIPWVMGTDKGFYAEEGIDLQIVAPPTVADTMKFLGTGRADVAFTTVTDIVFAKEQGAPVIGIGRYGTGNNWGLFSQNGSPLKVSDLKGKTIGAYNDAWTTAQLSMLLKSANLSVNDITVVTVADDTVPLLLQGRVDAITGITNAEGTEIVTMGGKKPEFIAAVDHGVPDTPILMFAGNQTWLQRNPELAKAFMRATQKSIHYAIKHPDEAVTAFGVKYSKAYDPVFIKQQWTDTLPILGQPDAKQLKFSAPAWNLLLKALTDQGVVKQPLPAAEYFTNDYIPAGN